MASGRYITRPGTAVRDSVRYVNSNFKPVAMGFLALAKTEGSLITKDEAKAIAQEKGKLPESLRVKWIKADVSFRDKQLGTWYSERLQDGGQYVTPAIRQMAQGKKSWGQDWTYIPVSKDVTKWIAKRSGTLIKDWSGLRKLAIREVFKQGLITDPMSTYDIQETIKAFIGLLPQQVASVAKEKARLERVNEERVANGQKPISVDNGVRLEAYRQKQIRAERIARTETSAAYNHGQLSAIKEAREAGYLGEDAKTWKEWLAYPGCCENCQAMNHQRMELEGEYPRHGGGSGYLKEQGPPLHPNCRCTLVYGVD